MSDDEDEYEYEYDDDDNDGDNMEEENQFQYTDDEEEQDDVVVALENAYYNAKGLRETSVSEATNALEQVIEQEKEQLQKDGGTKRYGIWSYKAMKQLVKLHLRVGSNTVNTGAGGVSGYLDQTTIMNYYNRLLECISTSGGSDISPALIEKGINTMLERVASLNNNRSNASVNVTNNKNQGSNSSNTTPTFTPSTLALAVYDATLSVFHPQTGTCKIERLWFKTNLKYGQLLYEMNETAKLQLVLRDLIQIHGEPDIVSNSNNYSDESNSSGTASVSTNSMEIYALQIQLYSRLKDNKKLRSTFHKAMNVRGGIPHPRTIALIQGKTSTIALLCARI
jgi:COP9 signalosome complex subunit 2